MKKELLLGFGSVVILLGAMLWFGQQYSASIQKRSPNAIGYQNTTNTNSQDQKPGLITMALVATHAEPKDCWISISGSVYDVSGYLTVHPGGAGTITPYCGKDATQAFATKDGQGSHSSFAQSQLALYRVGAVDTAAVPSNNDIAPQPVQPPPASPAKTITTTQPVTSPASNTTLTAAVVATHSLPANCWIIISNNVYAISGYLNLHPGGAGTITPYCGKDATQAFATKGGRGSHSQAAVQALANYLIGALNTSVPTVQVQQTPPSSLPPGTAGDDDYGKFDD